MTIPGWVGKQAHEPGTWLLKLRDLTKIQADNQVISASGLTHKKGNRSDLRVISLTHNLCNPGKRGGKQNYGHQFSLRIFGKNSLKGTKMLLERKRQISSMSSVLIAATIDTIRLLNSKNRARPQKSPKEVGGNFTMTHLSLKYCPTFGSSRTLPVPNDWKPWFHCSCHITKNISCQKTIVDMGFYQTSFEVNFLLNNLLVSFLSTFIR